MEIPRDILWTMTIFYCLCSTHTQVTFEGTGHYCHMETFNATCKQDEIIVMLSARYGRMKPGRCITGNYGNLGCSTVVLPYLDKKCSGRQVCTISIPDPNLHGSRPCPKDFTSYLEASYQCIRVSHGNLGCPDINMSPPLVAGDGFILGAVPDHPEDPSTLDCPWNIQALPGQRINLTLVNFARDTSTGHHLSHGQCVDVALVSETDRQESLQLCPHQSRERSVYVSASNRILLYTFPRRSTTSNSNVFLWRYIAVGCPDIELAPGMWVRRSEDQMVVRCNQTEETWYLICQEGEWKGRLGNCSMPRHLTSSGEISAGKGGSALPYGILITVAIGVALGIFLGGVLLVVVLVSRRYRIPTRRKSERDGRDSLRSKGPGFEGGYAPVHSECGLFAGPPGADHALCPTQLPCTGTDIDMVPTEGLYQKDYGCPHLDPAVVCLHHDCHLYESTRLGKTPAAKPDCTH